MTALGVIVGTLPIALDLEEGGDMLQAMAVAVVGGLLVGVFVALYLLPAFHTHAVRARPATSEVPVPETASGG